jgi:hypothetical protein
LRPDLEKYYLIDRYLANELKRDEQAAFEHRMQEDASFAQEVSEQKVLNNIILEAELKSVREQMTQDLPNITDQSFLGKHWKWFGAGVLLLSGIVYYTIPSPKTTPLLTEKIRIESTASSSSNNIQSDQTKEIYMNKNNAVTIEKTTESTILSNTDIIKTDLLQADTATRIHITPDKPVEKITQPNITQNQSTEIKKIDCGKTAIDFNVQTLATCIGEEEGKITIDAIEGGTRPYKYTFNEITSNKTSYSNLGSGEYSIKVTDKDGCSSEKTITIKEKNCIQQTNKFNINPSIGEICIIPFAKNKTGNLTVYSRSGMIIFKVTNHTEDTVEWNGNDGHGTLAEPGHYIYIIEYNDGSKESGEVNISR